MILDGPRTKETVQSITFGRRVEITADTFGGFPSLTTRSVMEAGCCRIPRFKDVARQGCESDHQGTRIGELVVIALLIS